jgi:hypothetical protein
MQREVSEPSERILTETSRSVRLPLPESMNDSRAYEMRAGDEPHEGAQARCSQCPREKEARHLGFEVSIQHRGAGNQRNIGSQRRRDVSEAAQVQAKAGSGYDVISTLGNDALGSSQLEPNAFTDGISSQDLVAQQHRHFSFDALAQPPGTLWTEEAQASSDATFLRKEPEDVR